MHVVVIAKINQWESDITFSILHSSFCRCTSYSPFQSHYCVCVCVCTHCCLLLLHVMRTKTVFWLLTTAEIIFFCNFLSPVFKCPFNHSPCNFILFLLTLLLLCVQVKINLKKNIYYFLYHLYISNQAVYLNRLSEYFYASTFYCAVFHVKKKKVFQSKV